ncbi:MAG: hypothetical protein KGL39_35320 [Patescibacteria group bacterium]|nr:hypothetical protein [Patescibacteria group bacterium]
MNGNQIRFAFDAVTKNKIVEGLAITIIGAACTYAIKFIIPTIDIGPIWTPVAVTLATNIVNIIYQWVKGLSVPQEQ